jgi:hypothetical protein
VRDFGFEELMRRGIEMGFTLEDERDSTWIVYGS